MLAHDDTALAHPSPSPADCDEPAVYGHGATHSEGPISSRLSRPSRFRRAAAADSAMSISAPVSGAYWIYLGSGPRREGDLASHVARLGGAPVINIDTKVGG